MPKVHQKNCERNYLKYNIKICTCLRFHFTEHFVKVFSRLFNYPFKVSSLQRGNISTMRVLILCSGVVSSILQINK